MGQARSRGSASAAAPPSLGASSSQFSGRYVKKSRTAASASTSLSKAPCATPDLVACACAPPSASCVTSSFVTVLTTFGPVTNMKLVSRTMKTKSVMAGE